MFPCDLLGLVEVVEEVDSKYFNTSIRVPIDGKREVRDSSTPNSKSLRFLDVDVASGCLSKLFQSFEEVDDGLFRC